MTSAYCTVLSKGRLYQAIALFGSLKAVQADAPIFTLCMDQDTYDVLQAMRPDNVTLIQVSALENEELLELKRTRDQSEYCWTVKPVFLEFVLDGHPELERVTYIDADLFFFADPRAIFDNQPDCSVLLSRGDIVIPSFEKQEIDMLQRLLGRYNSGFLSFKTDSAGTDCLRWWKERCLEECKNAPGEGKFGDQGYLDYMSGLFPNVCDITTPGVNIGHWNYGRHTFSWKDGRLVLEDGSPLIFYHFSGYRIVTAGDIRQIHETDRSDLPFVHQLYQDILKRVIGTVSAVCPEFSGFASEDDNK
ncbi:putative nucleotide-diphospho-sugar transferase [Bacillus velezensis]|uniref:putative nucleotide-diphospho-sugar transferase n=1 Tax=Bacillus amyloliquefaciens group TaxID=1938374 RepID=UPI0012492C25|nr:putative nucleotide-diphospho-sugar transferase [Bacillus amyloliquefaciens]